LENLSHYLHAFRFVFGEFVPDVGKFVDESMKNFGFIWNTHDRIESIFCCHMEMLVEPTFVARSNFIFMHNFLALAFEITDIIYIEILTNLKLI